MNTLITGDDMVLAVRLLRDGKPFQLIETAVIQAAVVSSDHQRKLTAHVTVAQDTAGSNWATSQIVVVIPKKSTAGIIDYGPALVEIEVSAVYTETWFVEILVVQGQINQDSGG